MTLRLILVQVVTCYLSFLCTRLLDLRNETRAARVIQSAWWRYKLQKDMQISQVMYMVKHFCTVLIHIRVFLKHIFHKQLRNQAARKIQVLVRCFIQKKRMNRQNMAATIIQAIWRGHSAREELRRLREAKYFAMRETAAVLIQV